MMRYFRLDLRDANRARSELWRRQEEAHLSLTEIYWRSVGLDASIWTRDARGEMELRLVLDLLTVNYKEGDEQQVIAKGFGL